MAYVCPSVSLARERHSRRPKNTKIKDGKVKNSMAWALLSAPVPQCPGKPVVNICQSRTQIPLSRTVTNISPAPDDVVCRQQFVTTSSKPTEAHFGYHTRCWHE